MQGRRTTDEEDEKEYENGDVGGLCEWNGWSKESEGSYFVILARGRDGMSMLRGGYARLRVILRDLAQGCVLAVWGRGVLERGCRKGEW